MSNWINGYTLDVIKTVFLIWGIISVVGLLILRNWISVTAVVLMLLAVLVGLLASLCLFYSASTMEFVLSAVLWLSALVVLCAVVRRERSVPGGGEGSFTSFGPELRMYARAGSTGSREVSAERLHQIT